MTETPLSAAGRPRKSIEVPLSPEDWVALSEMSAADFRRPAQMAAKLLHEAIARALEPAPKRPSRAKPKAIAVEQGPREGPLRMLSGGAFTDTVVTTSAAGTVGAVPYDEGGTLPQDNPAVFANGGQAETIRYAAGGVVGDPAAVLVTGPDPAGYGDEGADARPDRPDLRAQHHGYGQRVIADVPQA